MTSDILTAKNLPWTPVLYVIFILFLWFPLVFAVRRHQLCLVETNHQPLTALLSQPCLWRNTSCSGCNTTKQNTNLSCSTNMAEAKTSKNDWNFFLTETNSPWGYSEAPEPALSPSCLRPGLVLLDAALSPPSSSHGTSFLRGHTTWTWWPTSANRRAPDARSETSRWSAAVTLSVLTSCGVVSWRAAGPYAPAKSPSRCEPCLGCPELRSQRPAPSPCRDGTPERGPGLHI